MPARLRSCRTDNPRRRFTISMELNEIGGSLHGAPGILEVDGSRRRLSPLHGSRRWVPAAGHSPGSSRRPPASRSSIAPLPRGESSALKASLCGTVRLLSLPSSPLSEEPQGDLFPGCFRGRGLRRRTRSGRQAPACWRSGDACAALGCFGI